MPDEPLVGCRHRSGGIGEVIAGVLPAGKGDAVRQLHDGGRVGGDGRRRLNDAAVEASDLTLVRGDLLAVPDAIRLSRRTLATIKGNLFWAFGCNTAVIPLAALGFLNPPTAGAAMAFSSVFRSLHQPAAAPVPARRARHGHACRKRRMSAGRPAALLMRPTTSGRR